MFDVGFSELMVIGVVALVVVGPEKLPRVARTVGHLLGRMQRHVAEVKADISREIQLDEMRRLQSQITDSAREIESSIREQAQAFEASMQPVVSEVEGAGNEIKAIVAPVVQTEPLAPDTPAAVPADVPTVPADVPPVAEVDDSQLDLFAQPLPPKRVER